MKVWRITLKQLSLAGALATAGCTTVAFRTHGGGGTTGDESGFLSDYSKLRAVKDNAFERIYAAPDVFERAARYDAVMVDQPELFLDPASRYKGVKPDEMKLIADALRAHVTEELKDGGYAIVDAPGENIAYVRLAVSDLMLQKKSRPVLAYIPVGAVLHAVKNLSKDVTDKVDLKHMKLEAEVLDSISMEQLAAGVATRSGLNPAIDAQSAVSWEELDQLFDVAGKRMRCRLDNARLHETQRKDCALLAPMIGP